MTGKGKCGSLLGKVWRTRAAFRPEPETKQQQSVHTDDDDDDGGQLQFVPLLSTNLTDRHIVFPAASSQ